MKTILRLVRFRLVAGTGALALTSATRAMLCIKGSANVESAEAPVTLAENAARLVNGALSVRAAAGEATLLAFELASPDSAPPPGEILESRAISVPRGPGRLLRCDRVDFPPGGIAYRHTHAGPGIRYLLHGSLHVDAGEMACAVAPGEAWFESGVEPVLATASTTEPTAFVRVMVLPADYLGRSSIQYVREEDREKPKLQRYQIFLDQPFEL